MTPQTLKQIRKAKGLSQADVAALIGAPRSSYAYMESHAERLSIEDIRRIYGALGIDEKEPIEDSITEFPEPFEDDEELIQSDRSSELESILRDKQAIITSLHERIELQDEMFGFLMNVVGFMIEKHHQTFGFHETDKQADEEFAKIIREEYPFIEELTNPKRPASINLAMAMYSFQQITKDHYQSSVAMRTGYRRKSA